MKPEHLVTCIIGLIAIWFGVGLLTVGLLVRPIGEPTPYIVATGICLCVIGWRLFR